jgi:hypothetical protein
MKKQLVALLLLVTLLLLLSSSSLVNGYVNQYTAVDKVNQIIDPVSFSTESGNIIRLSNIYATKSVDTGIISNFLKSGDTVYLDIRNQTMANNSVVLTSVVYFQYSNQTFENLNKALLNSPNNNYGFFINGDEKDSLTPYSWTLYVDNSSLANNAKGFDFSNIDQLKISLLNNYNSQTLYHVGYLVSSSLAIITLLLAVGREQGSREFIQKHKLVFSLFIGPFVGFCVFIFFRLLFWSWMNSAVLGVTPSDALNANSTTLFSGIQDHLTNSFKHAPVATFSSTLYYLDQDFPFITIIPLSAFLFLPISILLGYFITLAFSINNFSIRLIRIRAQIVEVLRNRWYYILIYLVSFVVIYSICLFYLGIHNSLFNANQLKILNNILLADSIIIPFFILLLLRSLIVRERDTYGSEQICGY